MRKTRALDNPRLIARLGLLTLGICLTGQLASPPASQGDPLQGGIEEKGMIDQGYSGGASYAAPRMIPQAPRQAPLQVRPPIQGGAQQSAPPPVRRPAPIQAQITKVALPQSFLGAWNVMGQRTKVEAMPEFQAGAEQAFAPNTQNVWEISGNPESGYQMGSNSGVQTQLIVDKVEGNTAFIRYQHPIGKTMAQEAIVMSLVAGGVQFNGLERVSIVKEGMAQPRAKVTYNLMGQRQR